jgi:hypothetical protein
MSDVAHARGVRVGALIAVLFASAAGCKDTTAPQAAETVWSRTFLEPTVFHPDGLDLIGFSADGGITALKASTGELAWHTQIVRRGSVSLMWLGSSYVAQTDDFWSVAVYGDARTGAVRARAATLLPSQHPVALTDSWILVRSGDTVLAGLSAGADTVRWRLRFPRLCGGDNCRRYSVVGAIGNDVIVAETGDATRTTQFLRLGPTGVVSRFPVRTQQFGEFGAPIQPLTKAHGILPAVNAYWAQDGSNLVAFDASTGAQLWRKSDAELIGPMDVDDGATARVSSSADGRTLRVAFLVYVFRGQTEDYHMLELDARTGTVNRRDLLRLPQAALSERTGEPQGEYWGPCGENGMLIRNRKGEAQYFDWTAFRFVQQRGGTISPGYSELVPVGPSTLVLLRFPSEQRGVLSAVRCAP